MGISPSVGQDNLWLKVPIFCILLLTASSDSFGLKIKVLEEIHAESQALEFLKSVKYEPRNGCLKFIRRKKSMFEVHQRKRKHNFVYNFITASQPGYLSDFH